MVVSRYIARLRPVPSRVTAPTRSPRPSSSLRNPARRNCCSGVIGRPGASVGVAARKCSRSTASAARSASRCCTSRARSRSPRGSDASSSTAVDVVVTDQRGDRGVVDAPADRRRDRGRTWRARSAVGSAARRTVVDVRQHRRAQRLDHRRPQRVLRRTIAPRSVAAPPDESVRRSTRRTYRERSMRGRIAVRRIGHDDGVTHSAPARRHPCARPEPGAVGPALHPDARRPRRRGDQDRAAGRRPDPLRHAAPQRPVELLRAAERRQAQHQPRPVVEPRARRSSSSSPSTPTCSSRTTAPA